MAIRSLNQFLRIRLLVIRVRQRWHQLRHGVIFEGDVRMSLSARVSSGQRGSIQIGNETLIAFKTLLCSWDDLGRQVRPVRIGNRCFIGGGSTILPGVTIGDGSIVAAGAVVFEDVPTGCIVGGNPARVLRSGIEVRAFGQLPVAAENSRRLWRE